MSTSFFAVTELIIAVIQLIWKSGWLLTAREEGQSIRVGADR